MFDFLKLFAYGHEICFTQVFFFFSYAFKINEDDIFGSNYTNMMVKFSQKSLNLHLKSLINVQVRNIFLLLHGYYIELKSS